MSRKKSELENTLDVLLKELDKIMRIKLSIEVSIDYLKMRIQQDNDWNMRDGKV